MREPYTLFQQGVNWGPVLRGGCEAYQCYRTGDDRAFWSGPMGIGMQVYEMTDTTNQVSMLHARMVACRLRLAEVSARACAPPESPGHSGP